MKPSKTFTKQILLGVRAIAMHATTRAILGAVVLSLMVTGCFKPQSHPETSLEATDGEIDESRATFTVGPLTGDTEVSEWFPGFTIPTERTFNFKVCIRNSHTSDQVRQHSFDITGPDVKISKGTDDDGCLNWSEQIKYNFLQDEMVVPIRRVITARGTQTGSRVLNIGINPWMVSSETKLMRDLKKEEASRMFLGDKNRSRQLLAGLDENGRPMHKTLWPDGFEIQNQPGDASMSRRWRLKLNPSIVHKSALGQPVYPKLTAAQLEVSIAFIEVMNAGGRESRRVIWSTPTPVKMERLDEIFKAEMQVALEGNLNSRYQMMMRLSPVKGPVGLDAFEGIYDIGNYFQLTNDPKLGTSLRDSNVHGSFSYAAELVTLGVRASSGGTVTDPKDSRALSAGGVPNNATGITPQKTEAFSISTITAIMQGVAHETTTKRTLNYLVKACVQDNANAGREAVGVEFDIQKTDGTHVPQTTVSRPGDRGCLFWEEKIEHRFYEYEHYFLRKIVIRHASGFHEERTIALNPWVEYGFGFGKDMSLEGSYVEEVNRRPAVPSRLLVDNFGFDTVLFRQYEADDFLNLKTIKRFNMRFQLRARQTSNILYGRSNAPKPLRDGFYAFRSTLYAGSIDSAGHKTEFIVPMEGGPRLVEVRGGEAKPIVSIAAADLRLMKVRANLVFEFLPIDEDKITDDEKRGVPISRLRLNQIIDRESGLVTPTYVGAMWLKDEGGSRTVQPTEDLQKEMLGNRMTSDEVDSYRPLVNTTVEELDERYRLQHMAYSNLMDRERKVSEYAKRGNLEFVSLNNEATIVARDPSLKLNNQALPTNGTAQALVDLVNSKSVASRTAQKTHTDFLKQGIVEALNEKLDLPTLTAFVEGKTDLSMNLSARFCSVFLDELARRQAPDNQFMIDSPQVKMALVDDCIQTVQTKGARQAFSIDHQLRVLKIGKQRHIGSQSVGFKADADVSFSRSNQQSLQRSFGWTPIGALAGIGKMVPVPGLKLALSLPDALGFSASVNRSRADSTSLNEGSGIGAGASLNMEQVEMTFNLEKYESCVVMRMNPVYVESRASFLRFINKNMEPEKAISILSRGLLVCTGAENRDPRTVSEAYFSFAQGTIDETRIDIGDLMSHPWLISLRGVHDYSSFLQILVARKTDASQVSGRIDVGNVPLDRLGDAYRTYRGQMPAFPGFISVDSVPVPGAGQTGRQTN